MEFDFSKILIIRVVAVYSFLIKGYLMLIYGYSRLNLGHEFLCNQFLYTPCKQICPLFVIFCHCEKYPYLFMSMLKKKKRINLIQTYF